MEQNKPGQFYSGTSGLVLPVRNKQFVPLEFQNKTRLTYYASLFSSIEINSSFYKIPMASTVRNWTEQVPENFKFTFKLWREITHAKGLAFNKEDVGRFLKVIDNAGTKKGSLLIQFPPGLKVNMASQLEALLIAITEADPEHCWKKTLEFRHRSWYDESVFDLVQAFDFGIVMHDKPGAATLIQHVESDFVYLRFHGPNGDYRGHYDDGFLYEYAGYVKEWLGEGKTVFVYFNNTMGNAIKNLATLNSFLSQSEA